MTEAVNNTILIVDDSDLVRKVLKRIVTRMGFSVCEANNGAVAIEILSKFSPTCVISDVCMPVKDGFQVLDFARSQKYPVPVILSSSIPFEQEELYQRGVKGFIPKPFLPDEVQTLIARVILDNKHSDRRKHSRVEIKLPISINDLSGEYFRGTSSNLSREGIKIVLDFNGRSLPRHFSIDIDIDGTHFLIRKAEKVWEITEESNRLAIGCRFDEISDNTTAGLRKILSSDNRWPDYSE